MKLYVPIIIMFLLLSFLTISADTIKKDGLEIEVNLGESEFGDILEFNVQAKNTTGMEKTLLATIYLDPEQYKDMKDEHRSTPVYLEVLPNKTVQDVFYLIEDVLQPQTRLSNNLFTLYMGVMFKLIRYIWCSCKTV